MKIVCNREQMFAAFQIAASVAPARSPKEILQNIKLEVTDQGAFMTATDMEIGIRVRVAGVELEGEFGAIVLPVARFGSILRENSDETLTIQAGEKGTLIKGDRSRFQLTSMNPDEFPAVPRFNESKYHQISGRLLKELIRRTLFAVDSESGRFALSGVLLEMTGSLITAVGSDGRRLAKMEGKAEPVEDHQTSADSPTIVPARAMQLLERALTDGDEVIDLAARTNDLMIRSPRFEITCRLVEGKFPRWRDVIPQRTDSVRIPIQSGPLHAAVRQAAIVADNESRGIDFNFGEGSLVVHGASDTAGESRIELPIGYDGDPVTATLDFRYVSDFLKVLELDKSTTLDVKDADSAALFTTDDGYDYVVMPLSKAR